ncbi:hypothetical protein EMCG_05382 [[Emmonsia] crescens]|uniref:Uncharacterized protein n=1 Tax=[Emmonsia] crescens TaxID=73230 RepID=A0A0G2HQ43_9EURO|nr:hypothetical protein EMCG_05382 [Emmonsia crescens UAMH 3008]
MRASATRARACMRTRRRGRSARIKVLCVCSGILKGILNSARWSIGRCKLG